MLRPVLKDPELEKEFQKEGYVVIDFMPHEKAEVLKQKFFETLPASAGQITATETGFEMDEITYDFTFIDKNPEYKELVYNVITSELNAYKDKFLNNYEVIIANYIRKTPEKGGEVPLHQNWAFADEKKCCTVSIWIPLVDATIANGTLQVVPGSHKRFGQFRGPLVPWELEGIKNIIIEKYLKPIEIPVGKAVILDDSIVHYSAPNRTNELRLAIQLICIPSELPSIHYHKNPTAQNSKIEVLKVDREFYMHFNPWQVPKNVKKISEIDFVYRPLSENEFASRLYGERFDMPQKTSIIKTFLQKIKEVLEKRN
jgi:hypothetical protein